MVQVQKLKKGSLVVTIPKKIAEKLNIKKGSQLAFVADSDILARMMVIK